MSTLILKNVSFSYSDNRYKNIYDKKKENNEKEILYNINLTIEEGIDIAILGPSGCGKSTLLNLISGLINPTEGEIYFDKKLISSPTEEISMIFQDYGLFDWKNVRENIILPLKIKKKKIDYKKLDEFASLLKIEDEMDKYPSQLSGGEKQRVAICRAMMSNAKFLLMDEPFSALDPLTREFIRGEIRNILKKNSITTVIVTHSIEEAVFFGDKIVIFKDKSGNIYDTISNEFSGNLNSNSQEMIMKIRKIIFEGGADFY